MLTDVWTVEFELQFLPYKWARPDGNPRRPDGMVRRPNGWNSWQMSVRTGWHVVRTADREPKIFWLASSAESSESTLNNGIPIKKHLYIQVILSKQNVANHNLTASNKHQDNGMQNSLLL